jgi:hypothetical protein
VGDELLSLWKGDAAREMEAFEKVPRFCQTNGKVQARVLGPQEDIARLISRAEADGSCLEETGRFNLETHLACRCQRRAL